MTTALLWFRRDLRLADNPALQAALAHAEQLIPVYIHAPEEEAPWEPGAASRWWLHHSLDALDRRLRAAGSRLIIRLGPSLPALRRLIADTEATHVYWNRLYEPAVIQRDNQIKQALRADGLVCESFNAALLFEPWAVKTGQGQPYKVFTPFWKACQTQLTALTPDASPEVLPPLPYDLSSIPLLALKLLPRIGWDEGFYRVWQVGEIAAQQRLQDFLAVIDDYATQRDRPDLPHTSRLSPHLHFGEVSPRQIVHAVQIHLAHDAIAGGVKGAETYLRELGWREFGHHLLYHFPTTAETPLNPRFADFPWRRDYGESLHAWQRGRTGYPLVDAGLRELWQTGWMHNRVRMIVASLLTKNLRIPWQEGARWFWDTLVDADLANNTLGWQWVAGCGADAAPYFRIFNPMRQGERFDPEGNYVRRWVPELASLPDRYRQQPWEAPASLLNDCGVKLGDEYPYPIVNFQTSRAEALAAYERIK